MVDPPERGRSRRFRSLSRRRFLLGSVLTVGTVTSLVSNGTDAVLGDDGTATATLEAGRVAVEITNIKYDQGNQGPNGEYVDFQNTGSYPADMTNWYVEDKAGNRYTFPTFTLDPGAIVRLRSGSGTDTNTELYWGGGAIWNNNGDIAFLYDASGTLRDQFPESTNTTSLAVKRVKADGNGSLNREYVVFENSGSTALDLSGWTVEDEVAKTYAFDDASVDITAVAPGATITLRTGSGTDNTKNNGDIELYWGNGTPVWNNSGDTVFVYDDTGTKVLEYPY